MTDLGLLREGVQISSEKNNFYFLLLGLLEG